MVMIERMFSGVIAHCAILSTLVLNMRGSDTRGSLRRCIYACMARILERAMMAIRMNGHLLVLCKRKDRSSKLYNLRASKDDMILVRRCFRTS